jgi:integrase
VFTTRAGTHVSKSNLPRRVFRPALKAAKLPQVRFHDLRHSHCSILLRDGASIKADSQRLGHGGIEFTPRAYFHLLPDSDDLLAGQFDRLVACPETRRGHRRTPRS